MKRTVFSLLTAAILLVSASLAEKALPSREYFLNLDKGSRLEDIVEDIGQGGVKGSGIIYHTWHLDDGSEASVLFDSKGRIVIVKEGPHGYGDPVTKTYGTVKPENGKLIFIPDPEEP